MNLGYEVRRSIKRKKLTITVERDRSVVIHAPVHVSDEAIRKLVDRKRAWLFEKLHHEQKYQLLSPPPGKELVSGESALYLGRCYRIELTDDDRVGVRLFGRFLIPRVHANQRRHVLRHWYIEQAKQKILPRVRKYADDLGVNYQRATINDSRYRWGSCTTKNNLNFNWRLIKAPMFVIDYVIVHELAHLIEGNHTHRFWSIVRSQLPAMDRARDWLRDNGQCLEEEI